MKASYAVIVAALDNIPEITHEPEALGLSRAQTKQSTATATYVLYVLDYILPQVGKLSKMLQTEHLDLFLVSSLVESTLHTLEGGIPPAVSWVLELLDDLENLDEETGISFTRADITTFQQNIAKPFVSHLKDNISSHFASSSGVVPAMSILDPRKVPDVDSPDLPQYGNESIRTLLAHNGKEQPAETTVAETNIREAVISSEISSEWKVYRQFMTMKPKDDMKLQLKDLA